LGCGCGYIARRIIPKAFTYSGIDFAESNILECKKIIKSSDFVFIEENLYKFKWDRFHYDMVLLVEVLEHLYKDKATLKRIKSGTDIIITVPFNEPKNYDGKPRTYPTHQRSYTVESFKKRYGQILTDMEIEIFKNTWIICKCKRI
jgi:hypothetical protein